MNKERIGILTGGGDCAGLNPAIKWVVKTAMDQRLEVERGVQYEVLGIKNGWAGLMYEEGADLKLDDFVIPLNEQVVRTWDRYGGTMLGTSRTNPYNPQKDRSELVRANIKKLGLDSLIAIGGDDTLGVACKLAAEGVNVVGIPKTIDKDLVETDYTLGFETAVGVITEEVDRLRTTAGSHRRIFIVETMGRHSGWLALEGGESCGAFIILIPECDFSLERVSELLMEGRAAGSRYEIVLVAEGAKPLGYQEFVRREGVDGFGHKILGGIGDFLAGQIYKSTDAETRSVVLSHLQRGGAPCAYDRRMGRYFGIAAVDLIMLRDFGKMVCYRAGELTSCPIEKVLGRTSYVDVAKHYDLERYSGCRTIFRHKV